MITRIGQILGGLFVLLIAVILLRTFTYTSPAGSSDALDLPEPPPVPAMQVAQRLSKALQFKTITLVAGDPRPGLEGPWEEMQAWMAETYPTFYQVAAVERVPDTLTVLHTWPGSDPSLAPILFMAHQDVVPVNLGTASDWTHPAFDGVIADGFVYGRGTMDNKGNMIALLEMMEALALTGFAPKRTILVMFGHDEEVSGAGAKAGMAFLKSRGIAPAMAVDEGMLVVEASPLTGKPTAFIGVAEKGYLTLEVTVTAQGGHSSAPPRDSAAVRLGRVLVALDENQMPAHLSKPPVSDMFQAMASDLPFLQRMAMANLWLFGGLVESQLSASQTANPIQRTTTAPTMLIGSAKENVLAQRATAIVNFRVHPRDTIEDVIAHVKHVTRDIDGVSVARAAGGISGTEASPVSPTDTAGYRVLSEVARELSGTGTPIPALVTAATDARYAYAVTPNVYRFAPVRAAAGEISGIHGTDEKISIENLGRLVRGYGQIVLAMDAQPDP